MSISQKPKILVVDDSPDDIRLLINTLREQYTTSAATNADDALKLLEESAKPDIILLDINMPGTKGYAACKTIKQSPYLADIDVIFLSSNDSTQEVLDGFNAGASDYLVKPYAPEILLSKIKQCLTVRETKTRLAEAAKIAETIALNAMTDTGDLGTLMNFLRNSFNRHDLPGLAKEACATLQQFNLNACLRIYVDETICELSTEGEPSEIEKSVMLRLADSPEPIITMGNRLMLIKPHAVILIKNLPTDPDRAARIKAHLMILLEGIVTKSCYIQDHSRVDALLNDNLNKVSRQAEAALIDMQSQQEAHKKRFIDIMENMVHRVEESFFPLGLTDNQEDQLLNIMSEAVSTALDHLQTGLEMDNKVREIIRSLSGVTSVRQ